MGHVSSGSLNATAILIYMFCIPINQLQNIACTNTCTYVCICIYVYIVYRWFLCVRLITMESRQPFMQINYIAESCSFLYALILHPCLCTYICIHTYTLMYARIRSTNIQYVSTNRIFNICHTAALSIIIIICQLQFMSVINSATL